ncbi:GTPase activating protein (GAP) [Coemansia sp. RSA 2611]|nr:GTPase activating protein (GAP) [Coemansia sp. RSA 2611]
MFVLPAPSEPSAFWSDVKATKNFVLQQSVSTGGAFLKSVLATIQNVLETKPPPYRIVYRHDPSAIAYILLAVGETTGEIESDWKWLSENIMPVVAELDEPAERANFVVTKIRFLVSAEEGGQDVSADRKMRAATTTFRQTFNVGRSENLVTYYSCALNGSFMMHQGWLYLSENYFCFYSYMFGSEKKIMLQLRDIKDLHRARSMGGARDDAIEVVARDGTQYAFSNLFHRDETFEMLEQLTTNTMKRVLLNSEYATSQQQQQQQQSQPQQSGAQGHGRSPSDASAINPDTRLPVTPASAAAAAAATGLQGGRSLAEQIAQQRRNEELRSEFGLPRGEELLSMIDTATFTAPGSATTYRGQLYLSTAFVCFMARNQRGCRVTLPLAAVRRIERANAIDSYGLQCYELTITVWHQMSIAFRVPSSSNECNRWCDSLRGQLKAMVEEQQYAKVHHTALARYTLKAFCKSCASEHLLATAGNDSSAAELATDADVHADCLGKVFGFPGDPKTQKEKSKTKYWIRYMQEYGRNLTVIRRAEFDRLIRVGLPNSLRGEIWELSSGAMYLRFQNRGVYEKYVNDYLDHAGPCADEIEKDLNRSLPEYAGYQAPEGIDALRRVLNAYSLRDAELGYCQAMNIVASTMLIFMSEEQVFWTLSVMCDRMVPGYYSPSMYGASLDQAIFQSLVDETMPSLARSLQTHDIQLSIACLPWFLTLFVNSMPLVYALRVLDCFFLEGPKILFQIGLAILKINGGALLDATDDGTFMFVLKQYYATLGDSAYPDSKNTRARQVTKFHELLYVAYSDFPNITHARIVELRRSHQLRIVHSVEEFSKRTFLRNVIDASGFTKEQLSLLYDRYYSVLFYTRSRHADASAPSAKGDADEKILLDVFAFARFMYEISSWMRVQISEAKERIQSHRNVDMSDIRNASAARASAAKAKGDDIHQEIAKSLENPGWFITSLFRYTSQIMPPRSRISFQDGDSELEMPMSASASIDHRASTDRSSQPSSDDTQPEAASARLPADTSEPAPAATDNSQVDIARLRVSFQQCVIALGRIVNTDMLTRMDLFFDMYAVASPGAISRQEMFQLSEAVLYIGHGEDVETGRRDARTDSGDITNEEQLLRSVSDFLRRAVAYGERDAGQTEFALERNMFRVVVLEDEMLERFFADIVPVSFRFTDGVELANPKRAISTHLPTTPLTPRGADSMPSRILAGGRLVAEGMSARVAQTIALGSQFVDQRMLNPIVRNAAQTETVGPAAHGFVVSEDLADATELDNLEAHAEMAEPDDEIAEHMMQLSLRPEASEKDAPRTAAAADTAASESGRPQWVNAPQEPKANTPYDPYENLLDEVDQLLDEITDGDTTAAAATTTSKTQLAEIDDKELDAVLSQNAAARQHKDLDFQVDDEDDDDLTGLLKD